MTAEIDSSTRNFDRVDKLLAAIKSMTDDNKEIPGTLRKVHCRRHKKKNLIPGRA